MNRQIIVQSEKFANMTHNGKPIQPGKQYTFFRKGRMVAFFFEKESECDAQGFPTKSYYVCILSIVPLGKPKTLLTS